MLTWRRLVRSVVRRVLLSYATLHTEEMNVRKSAAQQLFLVAQTWFGIQRPLECCSDQPSKLERACMPAGAPVNPRPQLLLSLPGA